ncbi:MAG: hypothetical protein AB7N91_15395 [Candidatus Tectimicrobiota bacterium]
MMRMINQRIALGVLCLGLIASSAFAGGMSGTVTNVDGSGMATVKTDDGKEHKVKGEGWKVGAKVECDVKEGKTACKAM